MTRILGKAREAGLSDDLIRAHAIEVNINRMDGYLGEDELEKIIQSACKWEIGKSAPRVVSNERGTWRTEATETSERARPVYPIEAWEGTAVYEFARFVFAVTAASRRRCMPRRSGASSDRLSAIE